MTVNAGQLRMVGDYYAMRRAVNGARRIWVNTPWGSVRVTKRRFLRSTLVAKENRGNTLYEWWQTAQGDITPIARVDGEVRYELLAAVPGDRNYRGGVHPTTREEVPRGE